MDDCNAPTFSGSPSLLVQAPAGEWSPPIGPPAGSFLSTADGGLLVTPSGEFLAIP